MLFILSLILITGFSLEASGFTAPVEESRLEEVRVQFYSENIQVQYHPSLHFDVIIGINENDIKAFYDFYSNKPYHSLLNKLAYYKKRFALNDWIYFQLMTSCLEAIYPTKPDSYRNLISWVLLSKAGYDTRLTFAGDEVFVYVYSPEELYETPLIRDMGREFINLTSITKKATADTEGTLNMLSFIPNPAGKSFSFHLSQYPNFKENVIKQQLTFQHKRKVHKLEVELDKNVFELMRSYPLFEEQKYLEIPLSRTVAKSLLPQLEKLLKGLSQKEQVQLLVAFTRTAFSYKEDKDYFGRSKPMVADELFHYDFSDCEDRSALFYRLVSELMDLPMIVMAYSDHLTVAVALEESLGQPILFEGVKYYICDPTGPSNSLEIGSAPSGYEQKQFDILTMSN